MSFTRDNHYVPELYLKHFADAKGYLHRYRILVSRENVPEWKKYHVGGVAYQRHLYTRVAAGQETDEVEKWLNDEFETPAAGSLERAVTDRKLTREDYRLLARFLATQIVRTPAFLVENLPKWQKFTEAELPRTMENARRVFEEAHRTGTKVEISQTPNSDLFPLRVSAEPGPDPETSFVKAKTVVGRGYWIFAMRHVLTSTLNRLVDHRWTILSAEDDLPWFTTDDPVVRLNFRSASDYDFQGGWNVPKTTIFLPLSPRHLLFTEVAQKVPVRGSVLPRHQAILLRKIIAEHAHRNIFSPVVDPSISHLRPRVVSAQAVINEEQQWVRWHDEQSTAERELANPAPNAFEN